MDTRAHIEDIARSSVLTDGNDLQGLVALRDKLQQLVNDAETQPSEELVSIVNALVALLDDIVMRNTDDVEKAFQAILDGIETIQEIVEQSDECTEPSASNDTPSDDATPDAIDVDLENDDLIDEWIEACSDRISELEAWLLGLEAGQMEQEESDASVAEIRRVMHTIKGECGVLGLHDIQVLFHEAESAIDRVNEQQEPMPCDTLLSLLDWFRVHIGRMQSAPHTPPQNHESVLQRLQNVCSNVAGPSCETGGDATPSAIDSPSVTTEDTEATVSDDAETIARFDNEDGTNENLQEFLYESREHLQAAEQALLDLERAPDDNELINTVFRAFHTIKGVAGFMDLAPIVTLAHNSEFLLDAARTKQIQLTPAHLELVLIACDMLSHLLGMLEGGPAIKQQNFDALNDELMSASQGETPTSDLAPLRPVADESAPVSLPGESSSDAPSGSTETAPGTAQQDRSRRSPQTVKVSTARMDNLVTMVGELVIAQQMLVQDTVKLEIEDQNLHRNLTQVGKIVRDLQEASMSLRMVSLRSTFQKMARLVRDVSMRASKQINFHTEGDDVELDRNVVEEIADPLVHMVRNACDHGIEPADQRGEGKSEAGNVTLRAYHSGGSIVIEIEDDGRGLDREKILAKAIDKGVLPPDRKPEDMTDTEVFNLVFEPGFSTAEQVTDISGRGVGMDVVRRNIEALRGKVDIRSTFGQGTTFMMRLPLTMAIIDGMIVQVGSQRYVLPTLSIEQSFRPAPNQIKTVLDRGEMVEHRDSMLPVYRLNRVFTLNQGLNNPTEGLLIIIESNNTRCALMVDEIIGQQQIVIKNLGHGIDAIRGVSGGAILGDGRVALILDVTGIINEAVSAGAAASPGPAAVAA